MRHIHECLRQRLSPPVPTARHRGAASRDNVEGGSHASTNGPLSLEGEAPVSRQRLIDFQPDPVIAVTVLFLLSGVIAVNRKITGDSSALRERAGVKMRLGRWVPFTVSTVRSPGKRSAAGDAPDEHYNLVNVAK
jgi:hypothetical protein